MEAAMKEALLFVPYFSEETATGEDIQLIAFKQIGLSVIVVLAILGIAALIVI
jgi:hypothetical protein